MSSSTKDKDSPKATSPKKVIVGEGSDSPEKQMVPKSAEKSTRKRKRKNGSDSSEACDDGGEEALIDQAIEEKLQEVARKNNLSQIEMKRILKKLVGNEHVLALVKLQEEESLDELESSSEKFTRAKARALNQKPIPLPPLNETEPEPEVAALISQDLHSDEEDEEYHPHDDDLVSDDDPNGTISDIDSQPATPSYPTTPQKDDALVHYSQDGLFKVPRDRCDSLCSQSSQQEEIIAKRTRSKLCLQTTPIEAIESTFVPPDITTDMYDLDTDMDHAWMEFLNEFTKPLNTNTTVEEDDEADPEYVAADKVPIDREELRDVNISKKELSDLIAELFDGLVSNEAINQDDVPLETPKKTWDRSNEKSPIKKKPKINEAPCDVNVLNSSNEDFSLSGSNVLLSANASEFDPNIMSTPQANYKYSEKNENGNINDQREGSGTLQNYQQLNTPLNFAPVPLPLQTPPVTSQVNSSLSQGGGIFPIPSAQIYTAQSSHSTLQLLPLQGPHSGAFLAFPIAGGANPIPSVPCQITFPTNNQTNSPFVTLPVPFNRGPPQIVETIDITQSPEKDSSTSMAALSPKTNNQQSIQPSLKTNSSYPEPALPQSTATGSSSGGLTKKKKRPSLYRNLCFYPYEKWRNDLYVSINKYIHTEYAQKYEALKYETVDTTQFSEDQKGFTEFQLRILQQQMQIFVQFTIQHFFQTYCHPELWKLASEQKQLLQELQTKLEGKENAEFYPSNLEEGLTLIKDWEEELSVNSEENRELMNFLYEEIDKIKSTPNNGTAIMRFPPRIMKRLLNSHAILYPDMLPKIPFRFNVLIPYHEFAPTEDFLIALGMERFFAQMEEEEMKNPRPKSKISRLRIVCERIARDITVGKTPRRISNRINTQSHSEHYNPIKFYNERKKAPPAKHELRPLNLSNPQTPQQRISELPLLWKEFATNPQGTVSEPQTPDQRQEEEPFTPLKEPTPTRIQKTQISSTVNNNANQSGNNNITSANVVIHFNYHFNGAISSPVKSFQVSRNSDVSGSPRQSPGNDALLRHLEHIGPLLNSAISNDRGEVDVSGIFNNLNFSQTKEICSASCLDETPATDETFPPKEDLEIEPPEQSKDCIDLLPKGQKRLTDYFSFESISPSKSLSDENTKLRKRIKSRRVKFLSKFPKRRTYRKRLSGPEETRRLKIKLCLLVKCYYKRLQRIRRKYENKNLNRVHVCFKSLELYTGLLSKLKMNCKKAKGNMGTEDISAKRAKLNSEAANTSKSRKSVRTTEYLKRMVTPESQDEINKKDAIYALNFYDKVEETLKKDGKMENFKKFQSILKSFDPQKDQISEMYNKIEKIFVPDYPELAEIFLTFLLPGEAAQVGKFFEHFILTNMTTFINKLNLYFSKQPAQIKKVYSALGELSEDSEVTMEKIKEKILPLLKGNQFLTDWFLQNFQTETPPERLTNVPENINYKALEIPRTGERECEHLPSDELASDTGNDTRCQLKFLNGRIFYGSKILLPAKLAFLADDVSQEKFEECSSPGSYEDNRLTENSKVCVHGIRDFAEKCLKGASEASDEPEKIDEDPEVCETSKKYVVCDNATLRGHAVRLNPSLYASEKERRTASPKKSLKITLPISCKEKEKRKSPKKNLLKSPGSKRSPNGQSGSALDATSKAIGTAKRLKSLIEDNDGDDQNRLSKQKNDDKSIIEDVEEDAEDGELEDNSSDSDDAQKSYSDRLVMVEIKSTPWTRDEDKIILEEVKCGFDNEEILIKKLCENLPHRMESEIIHRHQFLMDVLSQLQSRG